MSLSVKPMLLKPRLAAVKYLTNVAQYLQSPTCFQKKKKEVRKQKQSLCGWRLMEASGERFWVTSGCQGDRSQIQRLDPICLPCTSEEVVIRRVLSDPLTSWMDGAIMGASGGKSQLPASSPWSTMDLLCLH